MTESFGARLRRQREQKKLTLADIAASTKINVALFRGLERDDVSRWPSGIFRRSFIRAYAEAIGLDPDAVCHEFLDRYPDEHGPAPIQATGPAAHGSAAPHVAPMAPAKHPPGAPAGAALVSPAGYSQPNGAPLLLRLTLADRGLPFSGGPLLRTLGSRWRAVTWDAGTLIAVALTVFVVLDAFWMPLGIAALCYYIGSILMLGNTPGVCLFAPKSHDDQNPHSGSIAEPFPSFDEPLRHIEEATSPPLSISSEAGA